MKPKQPRVTPNQLDLWSSNMSELYESLEGEIIRLIIKRFMRGHRDITQWQAQKLQELRLFNRDVTQLLADVVNVAESEIRRMFEVVGNRIVEDVDKAMPYPPEPKPNNLDQVMQGYFNQVWSEIDNFVNQTLVTTHYGRGTATKAYVDTLNKTTAMFNTGLYTFEDAVERAITELAQKGIESTFIDRGGHTWSLERYTRTVLKSTLNNTYDAVRKDRMADYGVHTVLVTSVVGARAQCSLIQGNVVDLRLPSEIPPDSKYRSIYDPYWNAEYGHPGGHRGVNCRHLHIPFIPGVNTNNQPKHDQALNERIAAAQAKQRAIERQIVKYKKNLIVAEAMGKTEKADYWRRMVRKRQKAMREHLAIPENAKYLSRNYRREKVYTPLETLLKDFSFDGEEMK